MNRRKRRRRPAKPYRKNSVKTKAMSFVMVICISVAAGYLTATYILGPVLGLEMEPTFFDFISEDKKKTENKEKPETKTVIEDKVETEIESGFAVQYGSFSEKNGARECADQLKAEGIEVKIIEKDGMYKVVGKVYSTKDDARDDIENTQDNEGLFITEIP